MLKSRKLLLISTLRLQQIRSYFCLICNVNPASFPFIQAILSIFSFQDHGLFAVFGQVIRRNPERYTLALEHNLLNPTSLSSNINHFLLSSLSFLLNNRLKLNKFILNYLNNWTHLQLFIQKKTLLRVFNNP